MYVHKLVKQIAQIVWRDDCRYFLNVQMSFCCSLRTTEFESIKRTNPHLQTVVQVDMTQQNWLTFWWKEDEHKCKDCTFQSNQPLLARSMAVSFPMPELAPVISTVLPSSFSVEDQDFRKIFLKYWEISLTHMFQLATFHMHKHTGYISTTLIPHKSGN